MLCGADAHFVGELGNCINYLDAGPGITPDSILSAERLWVGRRSQKTGLYWSQIIKGMKTRDLVLVRSHLRAAFLTYLRAAAGEKLYGKLRAISK